jgi:hypothetical protein
MNFEGIGSTLCLLENSDCKDKKQLKTLSISPDRKKCVESFTEIKLKDKPNLCFQPIPDKGTERTIRYVTGASGSGKSYWTKGYAEEYHRTYPKREIYIISSLKDDKTLDKLKYLKRIKIHEAAFLTDEVGAEDFKDSLVIFDDTDCLQNKVLKRKIDGLLNAILETGRHFNTEVVYTSHLACNGLDTRRILNECKSVTIFPSGLGGKSMKYLLDNYFGLSREQIKKIKRLNSRWVTIQKGFPMCVMSDKECFVLNNHEEDSDDEKSSKKKTI